MTPPQARKLIKIRDVRRLRRDGWTRQEIADHFGVSYATIGRIEDDGEDRLVRRHRKQAEAKAETKAEAETAESSASDKPTTEDIREALRVLRAAGVERVRFRPGGRAEVVMPTTAHFAL